MRKNDLIALAELRSLVRYLGEQSQYNWWPSAFFTPNSEAFLTPVFGKTSFVAQCQGVKTAAMRVHDEFIGIGRVYHLFRLPEHIEQELHQVLHEDAIKEKVLDPVKDTDTARACLKQFEGSDTGAAEGPIRIGPAGSFGGKRVWEKVASSAKCWRRKRPYEKSA